MHLRRPSLVRPENYNGPGTFTAYNCPTDLGCGPQIPFLSILSEIQVYARTTHSNATYAMHFPLSAISPTGKGVATGVWGRVDPPNFSPTKENRKFVRSKCHIRAYAILQVLANTATNHEYRHITNHQSV